MKKALIEALEKRYEAQIAEADATIKIYFENSVGIGEHPDVLGAIQEQLDIIAHEQERLEVLDKHFSDHP